MFLVCLHQSDFWDLCCFSVLIFGLSTADPYLPEKQYPNPDFFKKQQIKRSFPRQGKLRRSWGRCQDPEAHVTVSDKSWTVTETWCNDLHNWSAALDGCKPFRRDKDIFQPKWICDSIVLRFYLSFKVFWIVFLTFQAGAPTEIVQIIILSSCIHALLYLGVVCRFGKLILFFQKWKSESYQKLNRLLWNPTLLNPIFSNNLKIKISIFQNSSNKKFTINWSK